MVGNPQGVFDVAGGSCVFECDRDGSCKMAFNGNDGTFKSGSCFSYDFGGSCIGYPGQCGYSCHEQCWNPLVVYQHIE